MSEVLYIPEVLRSKLGEEGTKELVALINQAARSLKENVSETASERLERRIAETKSDLVKEIVNTRADMIKWMFIFWIGQIGVMTGVVFGLLKLMVK